MSFTKDQEAYLKNFADIGLEEEVNIIERNREVNLAVGNPIIEETPVVEEITP